MALVAPAPADVKADFPAFATVDDAVIQRRIDRTPADPNVPEASYTFARSLLTAHYLTLDGIGAGTDAELNALGLTGVARLRSASLDVSFREGVAGSNGGEYSETTYGRRFLALVNKGPLTTGGYDALGIGPVCHVGPDAVWITEQW